MICHYTEAGIDWNQSRVLFSVKLYISCAESVLRSTKTPGS